MSFETFDKIYLDLSDHAGKCRFAKDGFGWKASTGGDTFTLDNTQIGGAHWSRAAKGYEIKILDRTSRVIQLDGFASEDFERLVKIFKNWYSIALESKEHAIRGWNWGKAEFTKAELTFNVQNRPAFEIPYSEISNTNLAGRNEISVEMALPAEGEAGGNPKLGGARDKGKKSGAGKDQLVEMRFYVPGMATLKKVGEDGEELEEVEEKTAAALFYDTLMEKAEIGETAGDTIATFLEVLHLTPRGRFDIDMYESSFRLRGKSYDYKIKYESIKKFMVLPPDETHCMLCLGLDPPLRQGQTRYPFVVMQFNKDEETTIDLNISEEDLKTKYQDRLVGHYEQPLHQVVTYLFKGLGRKKISTPAKDFVTHRGTQGIKCSIKASEGHLFLLEKAFMFVPKPTTYVTYEQTQSVTFSRVEGAMSTLSTFDITVHMKNAGSWQFSNISREDLKAMEDFFRLKGLRVKNEIDEDAKLAAAAARAGLSDSDDEMVVRTADRGSADEDEESVDEDFQAESESDVAEEFDSEHESSGSGSGESDVDNEDGRDDDDDDEDEEMGDEPPAKKKKSAA